MKRVTAMVNGVQKFVRDYSVKPDIAMMHPTTLDELKAEIHAADSKPVRLALRGIELTPNQTAQRNEILFLMDDGSF